MFGPNFMILIALILIFVVVTLLPLKVATGIAYDVDTSWTKTLVQWIIMSVVTFLVIFLVLAFLSFAGVTAFSSL